MGRGPRAHGGNERRWRPTPIDSEATSSALLPRNPAHPKARALWITFALMAVYFLLLDVALGFFARSVWAAIVGLVLSGSGYAIGLVWSAHQGLFPGWRVPRRPGP